MRFFFGYLFDVSKVLSCVRLWEKFKRKKFSYKKIFLFLFSGLMVFLYLSLVESSSLSVFKIYFFR